MKDVYEEGEGLGYDKVLCGRAIFFPLRWGGTLPKFVLGIRRK